MPIYDRPTQHLMREFANEKLKEGQIFEKQLAVDWFKTNYPKINSNTVKMHVEGMSINSSLRRHHPNIREGSGHDLFYKVARGQYRLWDPKADPAPAYGEAAGSEQIESPSELEDRSEDETELFGSAFAYEKDLQNYLARNLESLEPGLKLYEEEGFRGIEYPAGSRRIDLLCLSSSEEFVVVELKVSRGSDRVIGQIMYYLAWVQKNLAEQKPVRGIIVANEISEELKLAASVLPNIKLCQYELAFRISQVS